MEKRPCFSFSAVSLQKRQKSDWGYYWGYIMGLHFLSNGVTNPGFCPPSKKHETALNPPYNAEI